MERLNVLIAIDEPDLAKTIISTACSIIPKENSEITLINVAENIPANNEMFYAQPMKYIEHEAAKADYSYLETCIENEGFKYKGFIYKEGDPAKHIINTAKDEKYDLVVIGSHNKHGFQEFFLGSVSKKVVMHSPCSVLIVKPSASAKITKDGNISALFATDGSACSLYAAENTARFVDTKHTDIAVLYVTYPLQEIIPADSYIYVDIERLMEDAKQAAKEILNQTGERMAKTHLHISEKYSIDGDPASTIIDEAERNLHNLIIAGSRGRGGVPKWLMGSVSTKIFDYAHTPVLIIKNSRYKENNNKNRQNY